MMIRYFILGLCCFGLLTAGDLENSFERVITGEKFYVTPSRSNLAAMHSASTLLISCVDFRLRDETWKLMEEQFFLKDDYDEIAIPGASLAYVTDEHLNWRSTIDDIVKLLRDLHGIKRVIFLDHYGCGAYKLIKGTGHTESRDLEFREHKVVLNYAALKLQERFPDIKVYKLIMGLDGVVEQISD